MDAIVESGGGADSESVATNTGEMPPDTDSDVTLANEFLPSAMGLTAVVEVPERLSVDVTAGIYEHEELAWEVRRDKDGKEFYPKAWWRRSIGRPIDVMSTELLGDGIVIVEKPVFHDTGEPGLVLHVVSRPYRLSMHSNKVRLITFTLVNRRLREDKAPRNSDCFFQCGFSVQGASGEACFLSYHERPRASGDPEELSLQLLYRHRQTFAVGHGCAPEWDQPNNGRTELIRTEVLPAYELKPVLPTQIEGLELRMIDLASDDPEAATAVCKRLADAYEGWIAEKEREIDLRSDLSDELKETARRHMSTCRECLRRLREGTELLEQNPDVALSFRLMNEAMLMQQIHYGLSSQMTRSWVNTSEGLKLEKPFNRPSYDDPGRQWRPFQLAFILMNLGSIANPHSEERRVVDVIWFPTGGGKNRSLSRTYRLRDVSETAS